MLNAYGFLKRVFEVFEKYKTPVDMITTSEVSVSVTIDQTTHLDAIMSDLREFAELENPDKDQVIICIVGNFWADKEGIAIKVLDAIKSIPIRMISYGASEHNISLLVDAKHKNDALNALNEGLFKNKTMLTIPFIRANSEITIQGLTKSMWQMHQKLYIN